MRLGHTAAHKGKRIQVTLKDGSRFIDKFMDRRKPYVFFKDRGKVHIGDIRVFSIYKSTTPLVKLDI